MSEKQTARLSIDYGHRTHPGGKKENEDYLSAYLDEAGERYCFVLADGLGGSRGGGEASQLAVESILSSFKKMDTENPGIWLNDALQEAHELIKSRNKADASPRKMKTTCVVAVIINGKAYWAWVGDSRIYVIRDKILLHRSRDHSVVQLLVDMGEIKPKDVLRHPDRNRVLKVLGMDEDMKPSVSADGLLLQHRDCILLCTDGFWEYINDSAIVSFMNNNFTTGAQKLVDALFKKIINTAGSNVRNGQQDNLSAQLIMVR